MWIGEYFRGSLGCIDIYELPTRKCRYTLGKEIEETARLGWMAAPQPDSLFEAAIESPRVFFGTR
jgi:hypothetical protein